MLCGHNSFALGEHSLHETFDVYVEVPVHVSTMIACGGDWALDFSELEAM